VVFRGGAIGFPRLRRIVSIGENVSGSQVGIQHGPIDGVRLYHHRHWRMWLVPCSEPCVVLIVLLSMMMALPIVVMDSDRSPSSRCPEADLAKLAVVPSLACLLNHLSIFDKSLQYNGRYSSVRASECHVRADGSKVSSARRAASRVAFFPVSATSGTAPSCVCASLTKASQIPTWIARPNGYRSGRTKLTRTATPHSICPLHVSLDQCLSSKHSCQSATARAH
jgi:hypothetical protein